MAAAALKNRIENLIAMAQLLERVDANPTLVGAQQYLHLVKAIQGSRYLIGNNRGKINGWVDRSNIHGRMIAREAAPLRRS